MIIERLFRLVSCSLFAMAPMKRHTDYPKDSPIYSDQQTKASMERTYQVANFIAGYGVEIKNREDLAIFNLFRSCHREYGEITFVAIHAYGSAAFKDLRSFYERTATLRYLINRPDEVARFIQHGENEITQFHEAHIKSGFDPTFWDETYGFAGLSQYHTERKKVEGVMRPWMSIAQIVSKLPEIYKSRFVDLYKAPTLFAHTGISSLIMGPEDNDEWHRIEAELSIIAINDANQLFSDVLEALVDFFSIDISPLISK